MEANQNNNIIVVHVAEIVCMFMKRLWIMVLVAVLFAAAGFTVGGMNKTIPRYTSTTKMYVTGVESTDISAGGMAIGQQVIRNYIEILWSRPVLEKTIKNVKLDISADELGSYIGVNVPEGTCMLEVSVTCEDAEMAKKLVDELVSVSSKTAKKILGSAIPTIYEAASLATEPIFVKTTSPVVFGLLGGIAGGGLVFVILLAFYFINGKVDTPNKITDKLHVKTLGVIPNSSAKNEEYREKAYQNFCANVQFENADAKVIEFVSATAKEKKYEFIQGIAKSLKEAGKNIIVVDANITNPEWGCQDKDSGSQGLEAFLQKKVQLTDIIQEKDGISYIHSKEAVPNGQELLSGDNYEGMICQLKRDYDVILIDTAPIRYVYDALSGIKQVDTMILVVSAKKSKVRQNKEVLELLKNKEISVAGSVLKDVDIQKSDKYFKKEFGKYYGVYLD